MDLDRYLGYDNWDALPTPSLLDEYGNDSEIDLGFKDHDQSWSPVTLPWFPVREPADYSTLDLCLKDLDQSWSQPGPESDIDLGFKGHDQSWSPLTRACHSIHGPARPWRRYARSSYSRSWPSLILPKLSSAQTSRSTISYSQADVMPAEIATRSTTTSDGLQHSFSSLGEPCGDRIPLLNRGRLLARHRKQSSIVASQQGLRCFSSQCPSHTQRWSVGCSALKQLLRRIVNGPSIGYLKLLASVFTMTAIPRVGAMDVGGGVHENQISGRFLMYISRGPWAQTLESTERLLISVNPSLVFLRRVPNL